MKRIQLLVIVDADGALLSRNLFNNVYMVDTSKWLGSWNEGACDLHTVCQDEQLIVWSVASISSDNQVNIKGFSGDLINKKICNPQQQGISSDVYWEGRIETRGSFGRFDYNIILTIDGIDLTFSPYIDVQ